METYRSHLRYGLLLNCRIPGIWTKLIIIVPIMEILPYLVMGRVFIPETDLSGYLYANMLWSFFSTVVLQCLLALQGFTEGDKLDLFLLADGDVVPWLCGYATGSCLTSLASAIVACTVLGLVLQYPVHALIMLGLSALSLLITLALVFFVFGVEVRWGRTFHIVNLALDVLQTLSCVAYPLAAVGSCALLVSVSPITWLNEFARYFSVNALVIALALSACILIISIIWVRKSLRAYRTHGKLGG